MCVTYPPEARVTSIPHAGSLVGERAYSAFGSCLEAISETDGGRALQIHHGLEETTAFRLNPTLEMRVYLNPPPLGSGG
jgi:hypothetical protein